MRMLKMILSMIVILSLCLAGCAASADGESSEPGYTQISQDEAIEMMDRDDGHVIVDVRRQDEYDSGHIPGAVLIPNESIGESQPEELPDLDQIILIYCRSGNRSKQAAQKLADMGYTNIYEFGGINTWTGGIVTDGQDSSEAKTETGNEQPGTVEAGTGRKEAVLTFDSFDGGGYEYSAEVEDPTVLSFTEERDYGNPDHDLEDGSPYTMAYTFTGLRPGTTTVTFHASSPVMDTEEWSYTAVVGEDLTVKISPLREISSLDLYRNGEIYYQSYSIREETGGYYMSVDGEDELPVSREAIDAVLRLIESYELDQWDGFDESAGDVLDGEGFRLEIMFKDGTGITAQGDNVFPEHYFDAISELQEILDEAAAEGSRQGTSDWPEPVGSVEITWLSSEDSMAFQGKEMEADPSYIARVASSDVLRCSEPLSRVEIRPIKEWAVDYSAYTIAEEILGTVDAVDADEAFRIYDYFPEGIPVNCAVFYLEDGSCGTFSLGFNGSGEEISHSIPVYMDDASMMTSLDRQMEEAAVSSILDEYKELAAKYHDPEQDVSEDAWRWIQDGVIPPYGIDYVDEDGTSHYYSSASHFLEVCGGMWEDIGITRVDLNDDGSQELLIGFRSSEEDEGEEATPLFAAYSVKGGTIQTLFHGWSRSTYYLAEDGSILHTGSGGAFNYDISKNRLAEDPAGMLFLQETETVVADGTGNPEMPFTWYPEGREIEEYDENRLPVYSFASAVPMDEDTGSEQYSRIFDQAVHVNLEEIPME